MAATLALFRFPFSSSTIFTSTPRRWASTSARTTSGEVKEYPIMRMLSRAEPIVFRTSSSAPRSGENAVCIEGDAVAGRGTLRAQQARPDSASQRNEFRIEYLRLSVQSGVFQKRRAWGKSLFPNGRGWTTTPCGGVRPCAVFARTQPCAEGGRAPAPFA